jgi:hypothetical protein
MVVKYKKPRVINGVSVTLFVMAGLALYMGFNLWPAYAISSRAKDVLYENLPNLYRANLRPDSTAGDMIAGLKRTVPLALRKEGVTDPDLQVTFERSKARVAIQAKFKIKVTFMWIDKTFAIPVSPRVETDAARIEW